MNQTVTFSCTCGEVAGSIAPVSSGTGTHIECYCRDCRAGHVWCGQPDPAPDGIQIFQTTPDTLSFQRGRDKLGLFRLSGKGILRWYATCCGAPLCNSLARPGLPFVGIIVDRLHTTDEIGPVRAQSFIPQGPGKPPRHAGAMRAAFGVLGRMISKRLSGQWRETPLFDVPHMTPVVEARILDGNERAELYARLQR